jgi:hypothetical protein
MLATSNVARRQYFGQEWLCDHRNLANLEKTNNDIPNQINLEKINMVQSDALTYGSKDLVSNLGAYSL